MAILLAVSAKSLNSQGAQTNVLKTSEFAFLINTIGDEFGTDKDTEAERARIQGLIDSAGPEIIPLLAATIREYKQHLDILHCNQRVGIANLGQ